VDKFANKVESLIRNYLCMRCGPTICLITVIRTSTSVCGTAVYPHMLRTSIADRRQSPPLTASYSRQCQCQYKFLFGSAAIALNGPRWYADVNRSVLSRDSKIPKVSGGDWRLSAILAAARQFVRFGTSGGAKFPKMGDSLPRTSLNHRQRSLWPSQDNQYTIPNEIQR